MKVRFEVAVVSGFSPDIKPVSPMKDPGFSPPIGQSEIGRGFSH